MPRSKTALAFTVLLLACAQPQQPLPPTPTDPAEVPDLTTPLDPPAPVDPPSDPDPEPPIDLLVPVRFTSTDPELALFAARVVERRPALETCGASERGDWTDAAGFVRVTIDEPVPRDAEGELVLSPIITGAGSPALHQCVQASLADLRFPATMGKQRRNQFGFAVDLRIGVRDESLIAENDHGDRLDVADDGGCTWVHDNPCKPNKRCMADTRRPTACPTAWQSPGPRVDDPSNRVIFYQRACSNAADTLCTLKFEREADRCEGRLRDGVDDESEPAIPMACADFDRLWKWTTAKGLPKPVTDGGGSAAAFSIGANRIEPGWSAYRAKRWSWEGEAEGALDGFEAALLEHAAALGLTP